ncbi:MAG: hypothetical protein ABII82_19595 [Verrucomicrobiota bacterium]
MNPAEYNALHVIHVFAAIVMVATVFLATAGSVESKKKVMMWSGIATLLVLLTGIRMWQAIYSFAGIWPIVKIVCWLGLSAFAGIAYRKREKAGLWINLSLALTAIALVMVYVRPF